MKEELYNNIERYHNGDMDAEEAAAFHQQIQADGELADEVWVHKRIADELGDSKKNALRDTLGQLNDEFSLSTPRRIGIRHWLPVISSAAAAAVAIYILVKAPVVDPAILQPEAPVISDIPPVGNGSIDNNGEPMPKSADEGSIKDPEKQKLIFQFVEEQEVDNELEQLLYQSLTDAEVNIFQPPIDEVLFPAPDELSYLINGSISSPNWTEQKKLDITILNTKEELLTEPMKTQWDESVEPAKLNIQFDFKLPEATGWYYYQIREEGSGPVLYTGKIGIYRETK